MKYSDNNSLATAVQAGTASMGDLWNNTERLVKWYAHRLITRLPPTSGIELDDLCQCGYLALVSAVDGFDATRGNFNQYFALCLKTEIAECTGYRTLKQRHDPLNMAVSLDDFAFAGDDSTPLIDTIPADGDPYADTEERIYNEQLHSILNECLNRLPPEQSEILRDRYFENLTVDAIAESKGVSHNTIAGRERLGLRGLRQPQSLRRLREFREQVFAAARHQTGLKAFKQRGSATENAAIKLVEGRHNER